MLLEYFDRTYALKGEVHEVHVPRGHAMGGKAVDDIEQGYGLQIIALHDHGHTHMAPVRSAEIPG